MNCYYCNTPQDLRPYGPKGTMVCFSCAMSTPERKQETEQNFAAQLLAITDDAILDGTEVGPYPAKHHPMINQLIETNNETFRN